MKKSILLFLLSSLFAMSAVAGDIRWSGFASVVGGQATGDFEKIDPQSGLIQGFDDKTEFKTGSFFGLQAQSDLGDGLGATVQVIGRGNDDWDPEFSWAYLSYDINDDWRILAGRQRLAFYLNSDYLDVSYAYTWITPPHEVYSLFFDTFDGVTSTYTFNFEDSSLTVLALYGSTDVDVLNGAATLDFENVTGGALTYNYDWLTLRAGHIQFKADLSGLGLGGRGLVTVRDIAMQIDYNDWLFLAETSLTDLDELAKSQEQKPWMVSLAKRFDAITPYVTYGKNKQTATTDGSIGAGAKRDTPWYSVGVRWDFHPSAALKFEYDHEENEAGDDAGLARVALVTVF